MTAVPRRKNQCLWIHGKAYRTSWLGGIRGHLPRKPLSHNFPLLSPLPLLLRQPQLAYSLTPIWRRKGRSRYWRRVRWLIRRWPSSRNDPPLPAFTVIACSWSSKSYFFLTIDLFLDHCASSNKAQGPIYLSLRPHKSYYCYIDHMIYNGTNYTGISLTPNFEIRLLSKWSGVQSPSTLETD